MKVKNLNKGLQSTRLSNKLNTNVMNNALAVSDYVRNKVKYLNGNLPMAVLELSNSQALCEHFELDSNEETVHLKTWFPMSELEKVVYGTA